MSVVGILRGEGDDDDDETKSIITLQTHCGVAKTLSKDDPVYPNFSPRTFIMHTHTLGPNLSRTLAIHVRNRFVFKTYVCTTRDANYGGVEVVVWFCGFYRFRHARVSSYFLLCGGQFRQ